MAQVPIAQSKREYPVVPGPRIQPGQMTKEYTELARFGGAIAGVGDIMAAYDQAQERIQVTEADTEALGGLLELDARYSQDQDYATMVSRWGKEANNLRSKILRRKGLSQLARKTIENRFDRDRSYYQRQIERYSQIKLEQHGRAEYYDGLEKILSSISEGLTEPQIAKVKLKELIADSVEAGYLRADAGKQSELRFLDYIDKAEAERVFKEALSQIQNNPADTATILKNYPDIDVKARTDLLREGRVQYRFKQGIDFEEQKKIEEEAEDEAWQLVFIEKNMSFDWLKENQARLSPDVLNRYTSILLSKEEEAKKLQKEKDPVNRQLYLEIQQGTITLPEQVDDYVAKGLISPADAKRHKKVLADLEKVSYELKAKILDMIDDVRTGDENAEKVKLKLIELAALGAEGQAKAEEYRKRLTTVINAIKKPDDPLNRPMVKRAFDALGYLRTSGLFVPGTGPEAKRRNTVTWMEIGNNFTDWVLKNPDAMDDEIETKFKKMIEPDVALGWFYKLFSYKETEKKKIKELTAEIKALPDDAFERWQKAKAKGVSAGEFLEEEKKKGYDYVAAIKAGAKPDETGHWPSQFKSDTSPERYVDGLDTKTAALKDVIATYVSLARKELGADASAEEVAKKAKAMAKAKGWKVEGKDRVRVIAPDGRAGTIPADKLTEYKTKGFKEEPKSVPSNFLATSGIDTQSVDKAIEERTVGPIQVSKPQSVRTESAQRWLHKVGRGLVSAGNDINKPAIEIGGQTLGYGNIPNLSIATTEHLLKFGRRFGASNKQIADTMQLEQEALISEWVDRLAEQYDWSEAEKTLALKWAKKQQVQYGIEK